MLVLARRDEAEARVRRQRAEAELARDEAMEIMAPDPVQIMAPDPVQISNAISMEEQDQRDNEEM